MDDSYLLILYLGDKQRGAAFQQACGARNWAVATSETPETALAMSAAYEPDLIIIDTLFKTDHQAFFAALRNVGDIPILVLTSTPDKYSQHGVRTIRPRASYAAMFKAVRELTSENKNGQETHSRPYSLVQ